MSLSLYICMCVCVCVCVHRIPNKQETTYQGFIYRIIIQTKESQTKWHIINKAASRKKEKLA